jgi:hypothetical protein
VHSRLLRPGLAALFDPAPPAPTRLRAAVHALERPIGDELIRSRLAA